MGHLGQGSLQVNSMGTKCDLADEVTLSPSIRTSTLAIHVAVHFTFRIVPLDLKTAAGSLVAPYGISQFHPSRVAP